MKKKVYTLKSNGFNLPMTFEADLMDSFQDDAGDDL